MLWFIGSGEHGTGMVSLVSVSVIYSSGFIFVLSVLRCFNICTKIDIIEQTEKNLVYVDFSATVYNSTTSLPP